jgi:symplekin
VAQKLVTYIFADFAARRELVHTWVYHEYVASPATRYPQLIEALLRALRALDPSNRAFNALIVEIPILPEEVWTMMCDYSTSRERVTLGLSTLRDLVVWRPPARKKYVPLPPVSLSLLTTSFRGLSLLLDYTHHEDDAIRSPAIRLVANQLYPLPALTQDIVDHACEMLRSLAPARSDSEMPDAELAQDAEMQEADLKIKTEPGTDGEKRTENGERKAQESEDKKEGDGDKGEEKPGNEPQELFTEPQIQRKLFLYFALCTKKHDLLFG